MRDIKELVEYVAEYLPEHYDTLMVMLDNYHSISGIRFTVYRTGSLTLEYPEDLFLIRKSRHSLWERLYRDEQDFYIGKDSGASAIYLSFGSNYCIFIGDDSKELSKEVPPL